MTSLGLVDEGRLVNVILDHINKHRLVDERLVAEPRLVDELGGSI